MNYAEKSLISRFEYCRKDLIARMRSARDDLGYAAQRLEKMSLEDDLAAKRMTIPINGLGVLQSKGPMIDNSCGQLEALYQAIKDLRELQ